MKYTIDELLEGIGHLTVNELNELIEAFKKRFNVAIAIPTSAQLPAGPEIPVIMEQSEYSVILANAGEKKLGIMKIVRDITGLSLLDTKKLVDGAPQEIKNGLSKEDAERIKKQLEDGGATVEIK